jgi:putative SOS response-associated peptidase YedK
MCGRFVSSTTSDEIAKYFDVDQVNESALEPNYNVAPSTDVYAVLETGGVRRLEPLHWGLVPIWAKDLKIGNRMINARAESLADKNAFKHAFAKKRCIIPADGFYEWQKLPGQKAKQPWYVEPADGKPLAFAGLWEVWRGPNRDSDEVVHSCTIITGAPNEKMARIHDRMPVILPPDAWDTWLDPEQHDLELLGKLLVPAPADRITLHPVSTEVNNVRNDGPQLIEPIELAADGALGDAAEGDEGEGGEAAST